MKILRKEGSIYWWGVPLLSVWLLSGPAALSLGAQGRASKQADQAYERETTQEYNRRLELLQPLVAERNPGRPSEDYRIGAEDLLEITVFEAPELNRSLRVSASGEISLPLLGGIKAAGLTPRALEFVVEELLRRAYMKNPHVGVFVRELQSHPVSVVGAVRKPGVFQIRGTRTLLEVLSLAEGLADDAGDTVIIMRGAGLTVGSEQNDNDKGAATPGSPPESEAAETNGAPPAPKKVAGEATIQVNLKDLLESGNPRYNMPVSPGDIVKVTRAGVVYVVGEVKKPGGFLLKTNENISVLQAIALGEGLTRTAAKSHARIIRTDERTGQRTETAIDVDKILTGTAPDPMLQPKDIVFVPNSAARSAWTRGLEVTLQTVSGVVIWRR